LLYGLSSSDQLLLIAIVVGVADATAAAGSIDQAGVRFLISLHINCKFVFGVLIIEYEGVNLDGGVAFALLRR
jgi:hypothetical protein